MSETNILVIGDRGSHQEGISPNTPPGGSGAGSPLVHRPVQGGILLPTNTDVNTETLVADLLFFKHPNRTSPALEAFHPYVYSPALINLDIKSDIVDRVPNTMKGAVGP